MRRNVAILLAASLAGCATERAAEAPVPPQGPAALLKPAELARVRCLLVAPLENVSDAPLAAEAATGAVLSAIDGTRTKVFPIPELRAIFRETPLELPAGLPPSLALELAEILGADAALWGSIEGRGNNRGDLGVTIRVSLVGDHELLFSHTALVRLGSGKGRARDTDAAVRAAVLEAVRPMAARLGDPGRKHCFDAERIKTLRKFALAVPPEGKAQKSLARATPPAPAPAAAPAAAPVVVPAAAAAPAAPADPLPAAKTAPGVVPRTPRQADWAKRLAGGGRILVEDVSFSGRTAQLQRDGGLADLAVALQSLPGLNVRVEGFVDATADRAADTKLSTAMAAAAAKRLADRGVGKQRILWSGRGGENPILPNFTARGRTANRRIEVVAVR